MNQTDIINKLNAIYPSLNLVECEDQFCSCDATNDTYLVEIKSREKQYRSWVIEKKKFDDNVVKSVETGKMFIYLTEYNGKIMTWNINKLVEQGYDFQWKIMELPQTTEFEETESITKEVGFLYEGSAKVHEEKE